MANDKKKTESAGDKMVSEAVWQASGLGLVEAVAGMFLGGSSSKKNAVDVAASALGADKDN